MNQTWREKYLEALAEQEKLEQQIAAHSDMLRRTIMHLGAASDGLDKSLDAELVELRNKLRGAGGAAVNKQLLRVEEAVKTWHKDRAQHTRATCDTLQGFTAQLSELRIDGDTRTHLKKFDRSVTPDAISLYQQADWLKQLLALQKQAIKDASAPDTTVWQRLSGNTRLQTQSTDNKESSIALSEPKEQEALAVNATTPTTDSAAVTAIDSHNPNNEEAATNTAANTAADAVASPVAIDEQGELEALLHEIFSTIVPTEELAESIIDTRKQIDKGVSSENLPIFLRTIRDTLQASYMNYGTEFSRYLIHMDAELTRISEALEYHLEDAARQITERALQDQSIKESHHKLSYSNEKSAALGELKTAVEDHLVTIQKALTDKQKNHAETEENHKKLKDVVDKVQQVETEAKASKALLETEEHQANRDALTGLANRPVCSQKLQDECEKFQRYGHPVTVALCNIDGLAKFNDYSYIIGDRVLKLVAKTLKERLRPVDFIGRFNGDKFLIIMPETATNACQGTLDKIRAFIAKTPLNIKGKPVKVTLSFSVTTFKKDEDGTDSYERLAEGLNKLHNDGGNNTAVF